MSLRSAARRRPLRALVWLGVWLSWLFGPCVGAPWVGVAGAQRIEVHAPCADEAAVRAQLAELGAEAPARSALRLRTTTSWAGLVRGELRLTQGEGALVRVVEDERCEDVVRALLVAAALALREGFAVAEREIARGPDVLELEVHEHESPRPRALPSRQTLARASVGLEARVGLGPVPGIGVAPGVVGTLEIDLLWLALHAVYWAPGQALGERDAGVGANVEAALAGLEVGVRSEGDVAVMLAGSLEAGGSLARAVGRDPAPEVGSGLCDVGVVIGMDVRLGRGAFFVRLDLLAALVRPSYLVGDAVAFEAPPLRGSVGVGFRYAP